MRDQDYYLDMLDAEPDNQDNPYWSDTLDQLDIEVNSDILDDLATCTEFGL